MEESELDGYMKAQRLWQLKVICLELSTKSNELTDNKEIIKKAKGLYEELKKDGYTNG